jgi:hypothetical protein
MPRLPYTHTSSSLLSAVPCKCFLNARDQSLTHSAVALSIPTWFLFPAHPTKAKFLSEHDKYIALERIRLNNTGTQNTREYHSSWLGCR